MDEDKTLDQDVDSDIDESIKGETNDQSDDNKGSADDAPQPVKIGDKEYTPDQITALEKESKDYKALLPDYTRKSQKLAEYEKSSQTTEHKSRLADPNYKPKDYKEFADDVIADYEARKAVETQAQTEAREKVEAEVNTYLDNIKQTDKDFDRNDFVDYVKRHGFNPQTMDQLKGVYSTYKELAKAGALGEQRGRQNRQGRDDKIDAGGSGNKSGVDFSDIRASGRSIVDGAFDALSRLTNK